MVGEGLVLENVEKPLLEEEQVERPRDEMSGKVVRKAADMRSVIKVQLLNTAQGQENWLPGKTGKIKKSPVPKGLRYLGAQAWPSPTESTTPSGAADLELDPREHVRSQSQTSKPENSSLKTHNSIC